MTTLAHDPLRRRPPRASAAPYVLACLVATLFVGDVQAHDPSFARWDVGFEKDALLVRLRTSGRGLQAAMAAQRAAASDGPEGERDEEPTLDDFFRESVRVAEQEAPLVLREVDVRSGHEASVTLVFARTQGGAPKQLSMDVSAYAATPHQHHLVFIHVGGRRDRIMLNPSSGHAFSWPPPAATARTPVRAPTDAAVSTPTRSNSTPSISTPSISTPSISTPSISTRSTPAEATSSLAPIRSEQP